MTTSLVLRRLGVGIRYRSRGVRQRPSGEDEALCRRGGDRLAGPSAWRVGATTPVVGGLCPDFSAGCGLRLLPHALFSREDHDTRLAPSPTIEAFPRLDGGLDESVWVVKLVEELLYGIVVDSERDTVPVGVEGGALVLWTTKPTVHLEAMACEGLSESIPRHGGFHDEEIRGETGAQPRTEGVDRVRRQAWV
jgi:hypothetical protein